MRITFRSPLYFLIVISTQSFFLVVINSSLLLWFVSYFDSIYFSCFRISAISLPNAPFDLIHIDIWGPYHKTTYDGKQYFLTIVDDATRFTWLYLLKEKSDAAACIKVFFKFIQTQFDKQIKQLRSDNAPELLLRDFLQEQGTTHQFSCPQNSVVERKHQHLLNVARSLMFQSRVPIHFWGECVVTATFLINRSHQHQSLIIFLLMSLYMARLRTILISRCLAACVLLQFSHLTEQSSHQGLCQQFSWDILLGIKATRCMICSPNSS